MREAGLEDGVTGVKGGGGNKETYLQYSKLL